MDPNDMLTQKVNLCERTYKDEHTAIWERDVLVDFHTYKVHATHPDQPNFSGNSRGRKSHMSKSNKRGDFTLCNKLVDEPYREQIDLRIDKVWKENYLDNGFCLTCKEAFNKGKHKSERIK